jgi:hypothetical protein
VGGLIGDGVLRMDVLVRYYNGCPLRFAPAAHGVTTAGPSAGSYFAPQLNVGYDGDSGSGNQAILRAGASGAIGARVNLPASIGWGEWVWFRLELDCADTASTGNVLATASYRNLSDNEGTFTVIPGLENISLSVSTMTSGAQDPATWTSVWLRYDNNFSTAGHIAAIEVEQPESPPRVRTVWSTPFAASIGLENSHTSVAADLDQFYVIVTNPDLSATVVALDEQGNVLSSSDILSAGEVFDDPHNTFSIGVDPLGYLHVTGNHHNDEWNYWVSDMPRSAASFTDYSTPDGGHIWGNSKIGGRFSTYPNFYRDNYGRLWLTARTKAKDDAALVAPGAHVLEGYRGGLLARYDPHNLKVWEAVGARAPVEGNTWRLPMVTWDETGRAANPTENVEWYQAYRIGLDFDSQNNMHLSWIGHGSVAEGAAYAEDSLSGATHLSYMQRRDSDGVFFDAAGGVVTLPASRWDADLIYSNPGDFSFWSYVTTGDGDEPFVTYSRGGVQYLLREDVANGWEEVVIPVIVADPMVRVMHHPDVGLVVPDQDRVIVSQDRGDNWDIVASPHFKHVDEAFFRQTGNLVGLNVDGSGNLNLVEIRFNNSPTPIVVDDPDFSVRANEVLNIAAPGVLGNDFHPELSAVTVSVASAPVNGAVTLNADGSFSYTPDADFVGEDSFVYELQDGAGQTAQGNATVTVRPALSEAGGYEGFDLLQGTLGTRAGGSSYGFEGNWQQAFLDPADSPLSVNAPTLQFNGSGIGYHLGQDANGTTEDAYRRFSNPLSFSTGESQTRYFSFVVRAAATPTTGQELVAFYLVDRFGDPVAAYRRYGNSRVSCQMGTVAANSTDAGQSQQTFDPLSGDWLIVMKMVTHPTNPDVLYVKAYQNGDLLEEPVATGPGEDTWSVLAQDYTDVVVDGVRLRVTDAGLGFDELRIGGSFESVTASLISNGVSVFTSQLSVMEEDGAVLPFFLSRGDSNGPLSVYYTMSGDAVADSDYENPTGVIQFTDGQSIVPLSIPVINDSEVEDDEKVTVSLLEDAGYSISNQGYADVTIAFNDLIDLYGNSFHQAAQTEQVVPVVLHNPKSESISYQISTEITQDLTYTEQLSTQPGGPAYEWIEISGTGTPLPSLHNEDQNPDAFSVLVDLGDFSFPFYGETITALYITPHGMISPDLDPTIDYKTHFSFDLRFFPKPVIAAMWTWWKVGNNSEIYYQQVDADTFVVQYENVHAWDQLNHRATFQIVIKRSGLIRFNYKTDNLPVTAHDFTVGIRKNDTEYTMTYREYLNTSAPNFIQPQMSIQYLNPHLWMIPGQTSVTLAPGETLSLNLGLYSYAFSNGHTESGSLVFNLPAFTREERFDFQMNVGSLSEAEQWRWDHFGHVFDLGDAAELADPDADTVVNLLEYGLGSSPLEAGPNAVSFGPGGTGTFIFSFTRAASDLDYILESSTTLAPDSWTEVLRNPGLTGELIELEITPGETNEFYRLRLERP